MSSRYGNLFQIDSFDQPGSAQILDRISLTGSKASSGYNEAWLQRLLANHPRALPIAEIETFLADAKPICVEMATAAGPVDLLLVSPRGDIVLVECKLWRNPQARREVVGQIIDYAKELPRLTYEAFEAAIRKAVPAGGQTQTDSLYVRAGSEDASMDEAGFADAVSRNLRRGRFLLLIVGDGIQEGVEAIVEFLQQHAGMHFTLALVELAIFKGSPCGYVVQPRVIAKTVMVPRGVVSIQDGRIAVNHDPASGASIYASSKDAASSAKSAVPATISEARLFELLEAKLPGVTSRLQHFIAMLEGFGSGPRFTPAYIILQGAIAGETFTLATISAAEAAVYFDYVLSESDKIGRKEAALAYYRSLAALIGDEKIRVKKLNPDTKTGTAGLPLNDLLQRGADWLTAAQNYLDALRRNLPPP